MTVTVRTPSVGVGNALRRTILNELETYAPHEVLVRENSSLLTDEMLAFNLAWLKLTACPSVGGGQHADLVLPSALTIDVCNTTSKTRAVRGSDFTVNALAISVAEPTALVCKLGPGEALRLDVDVARGRGATHCKFSPASRVGLRVADGGPASAELTVVPAAGECGRSITVNAQAALLDELDRLALAVEACELL
uniref:DNA-directed RNA polymerase RpoA/D/Rpb3-type domain-containing protein n=1 Tax=viral metagenome TaxID=1070528 RepID=A0A6C0KG53_9ZZZZ